MMIVNAPTLFTGIWAIVKNFLDERTRAKIQIIGSKYKDKLLALIDEDQLHVSLGGKNTAELISDAGPWNDFELVDSD